MKQNKLEAEQIVGHKCNGEKWRPYPKDLCSACGTNSQSFDMTFDNKKQYDELTTKFKK